MQLAEHRTMAASCGFDALFVDPERNPTDPRRRPTQASSRWSGNHPKRRNGQ